MIEKLKKTFNTFNKKFTAWEIQEKKRSENFNKFVEMGFPTKKLEDWKYSNFSQIISKNLKNLNIDLDDWMNWEFTNPEINKKKINFNNYLKQFKHNKVVFTNGFCSHSEPFRQASTFNCSARPAHNYQRLCFCSTPLGNEKLYK